MILKVLADPLQCMLRVDPNPTQMIRVADAG